MEATPIGGPEDFLRAARQLHIDPMSYSLDGGHLDGRYVLGRDGHSWVVYYSMDRLATGTESFVTQPEALTFLLRVLTGDPTTRLPMSLISTVTVVSAVGRLLLTPQRHEMLRTPEDFASSRVLSINAAPTAIVSAIRELLVLPAIEPGRLIPNSPDAKRAQARHRTGMMKSFGVARTTDWIVGARCVSVYEVDGWVTFTPSRHARPKQEVFAWMPDRTITVPASDQPSNLADALLEALHWCT